MKINAVITTELVSVTLDGLEASMIKSFEREKMKLAEAEAYLKALYFEAILKIKFKSEVQYASDVSSVLNEYKGLTGEKNEQVIVSGLGVLKSTPITQAKALYDQKNLLIILA